MQCLQPAFTRRANAGVVAARVEVRAAFSGNAADTARAEQA